jgi:FkbM family methyltransferase
MHIRSLFHPKAEYVFRPSQIVRRLIREYVPSRNEYEEVRLPWGLPIRIRPGDSDGSWIWRLGVKELPVTEVIYRLVDRDEVAVDVGANIGHMTSVMAFRTGSDGRVLAFEPHPFTFAELQVNVHGWAQVPGIADIQIHQIALSDSAGDGALEVPGDDSVNRGLASLRQTDEGVRSRYPVQIRRMDEFVADEDKIGVMKVDVEGLEFQVLKGAEPVLRRHGIRDIIFEDYNRYPTEATALLQGAGYAIFSINLDLWGLKINPPSTQSETREGYIPNYLATCDPERALTRLGRKGWQALRPKLTRPRMRLE